LALSKRKEKPRAKIGTFVQQYARQAQYRQEPNDRGYSQAIEAKIKRMKPEELDELLNGEQDVFLKPEHKRNGGSKPTQGPLKRGM